MIYISYLLSLTNFLLNIIAVYKNKKELITYTRDITDIIICSNKIILFSYYVYYNIDFTLPLSQLLLTQNANINISNVLTYNIIDYYSTSIIYLYEGNYEYLYHHIITIFCINVCQLYLYHVSTILSLLIFMISSPFFSLAKFFKHNNYEKSAKFTFIIFGITFFICRILIFTYLFSISLFNEYYNTPQYYIINGAELLIYKMQLNWMYKIYKTIMNNYN